MRWSIAFRAMPPTGPRQRGKAREALWGRVHRAIDQRPLLGRQKLEERVEPEGRKLLEQFLEGERTSSSNWRAVGRRDDGGGAEHCLGCIFLWTYTASGE